MTKTRPAIDRLLARTVPEPNSGCWLWEGSHGENGYGRIGVFGRRSPALTHRVSFEHFKGAIPDGMTIDHLCRNKACVNPDHLEAVTQLENNRRGLVYEAAARAKLSRTHCKRGHAYTPDNVKITVMGARSCRECGRIRERVEYLRARQSRISAIPTF